MTKEETIQYDERGDYPIISDETVDYQASSNKTGNYVAQSRTQIRVFSNISKKREDYPDYLTKQETIWSD